MALSNPFNPPPNTPLLPDPQRDSVWRRWFEQLWRRIQTGALGGTVTSVAVSAPVEFTVSGSPITTSGTIAITKATETANTVWAGPTTGAAAQPAFRALVTADLPAGTGTVTSVGLSLPTSVFDVTGSPVTTSGTLAATFDTQSANTAFMGPTTGSAATPAFRALVAADIAGLAADPLLIIYNNENLDIATNVQVTGHADLTFQGTGELIIAGTGSLEIVGGDTTGTSGLSAATQAEMEAGTSILVATTPGRQQYHPSASKGWVKAGVSANILASYNVTSLTDGGTGLLTVTWDVDFSSGDYSALSSALNAQAQTSRYTRIYGQAAGSLNVLFEVSNSGALDDPTYYYVAAFGDQ